MLPHPPVFSRQKCSHTSTTDIQLQYTKGLASYTKKAARCFLCLVFRFFCNPQRITDITNMQSAILLALQNNHLSRPFIKSVPTQPKKHHISYQDFLYLGSAPGIEGQHAQCLGPRQRTSGPKSQVQLKGIRKL